jgi:L-fuconolactonase
MIIDSHQHFWQYDPKRDTWIDDTMQVIRNDFMPGDLKKIFRKNGIDGCVAVQASESHEETDFLLNLARKEGFIQGVVGWIDFEHPRFPEILEEYSDQKMLKGFRHILQAVEPDYMLRDGFLKGIQALNKHGFTYDLLLFTRHLDAAIELTRKVPDQLFVVDHLAKPPIKKRELSPWREKMFQLAEAENVYCKISGMVTEADWENWKPDDMKPYLDTVVKGFGTHRLMYGSDWPVCLLAGSYEDTWQLSRNYFKDFSKVEKNAIFGENASRFYQLTAE